MTQDSTRTPDKRLMNILDAHIFIVNIFNGF